MKHLLLIISLVFLTSKISFSQEQNIHKVKYIFDPKNDAKADVEAAVKEAAIDHRPVFLLIGGDWSYWSRLFYNTMDKEPFNRLLAEKYIFLLINFSPSNKNEELLTSLGSPKYAGYPIIMLLNEKGNKIHCQNSDEFKIDTRNYDENRILDSLKSWALPVSKK